MPTTRMPRPGRPVVILLDTHRPLLIDTEANSDIAPDASRTFAPPCAEGWTPRLRVCWVCAATWIAALATVAGTLGLLTLGARELVRAWGA